MEGFYTEFPVAYVSLQTNEQPPKTIDCISRNVSDIVKDGFGAKCGRLHKMDFLGAVNMMLCLIRFF